MKSKEETGKAKKPAKKKKITAEYKVIKVGYPRENPKGNIILLSKKERKELNVELNSVVKLLNATKKEIAIVQKQLQEYVGEGKVCTLNSVLAKKLGLKENDNVEVTKEVTETEYKKYKMAFMNPLGFY